MLQESRRARGRGGNAVAATDASLALSSPVAGAQPLEVAGRWREGRRRRKRRRGRRSRRRSEDEDYDSDVHAAFEATAGRTRRYGLHPDKDDG